MIYTTEDISRVALKAKIKRSMQRQLEADFKEVGQVAERLGMRMKLYEKLVCELMKECIAELEKEMVDSGICYTSSCR